MPTIAPGTACYIVKSSSHPEWIGRVIVAVRKLHAVPVQNPVTGQMLRCTGWLVDAAWLPIWGHEGWVFLERSLRPIHGPAIEVDRYAAAATLECR